VDGLTIVLDITTFVSLSSFSRPTPFYVFTVCPLTVSSSIRVHLTCLADSECHAAAVVVAVFAIWGDMERRGTFRATIINYQTGQPTHLGASPLLAPL
jgi:hypothetical protein